MEDVLDASERLMELVPLDKREEARELLDAAFQEHLGAAGGEGARTAVHDGIRDIADTIVVAKSQISRLSLPEDKRNKVQEATSELDEIVRTTEEATNQILTASEEIDRAVSNMRVSGVLSPIELEKIQNEYMNIIMACSFQDITGQRTQKVISALHYIEDKVDELMDILRIERSDDTRRKSDDKSDRPDEDLMHGPVTPGGAAIDQSSIDSLFD